MKSDGEGLASKLNRLRLTPAGTYEKQIAEILRALGIEDRFRKRQPVPEATELVSVGRDIYGREQKLAPDAAAAWIKMKQAAEADGKFLLLVSAFRSVAYQRQIVERKLAAGQAMEQILQVSAAPGFSQHHSGGVIDVTAQNGQPLTEEFERTAEFLWLRRHDIGNTECPMYTCARLIPVPQCPEMLNEPLRLLS